VLDPIADRMIVCGGTEFYGPMYPELIHAPFDDAWALDLSGAGAWTPLAPAGPAPSPRAFPGAVFDARRERMVLFGGVARDTVFGDAWALDLAGDPAWTPLQPLGAAPLPRYGETAVYDSLDDEMIVFGGYGAAADQVLNDVWSLRFGGVLATPPAAAAGSALGPPAPNPTAGNSAVSLRLPAAARVSLVICDVAGRAVRALGERTLPAGVHRLAWDGRTERGAVAAPGLYFYRLRVDGRSLARKVMVLGR